MWIPAASDGHGLPARERVLLTAYRLFYREGIQATGINRLIGESCVTKVTFYRHFPSKLELVCAYLQQRHTLWIEWFSGALERCGGGPGAVVPALAEWLESDDFRGCAFINSVGEVGAVEPAVRALALQHKQAMAQLLQAHLPASETAHETALALALIVDGAIVGVQLGESPSSVLASVSRLLALVCPPGPTAPAPVKLRSAPPQC